MKARIFQPPKNAMQSGRANAQKWVLEVIGQPRREADPLMGWIGSQGTAQQIKMRFATKDDAIAFAERNGYAFEVSEPHTRKIKPKNYADNFRYDNPMPSSG